MPALFGVLRKNKTCLHNGRYDSINRRYDFVTHIDLVRYGNAIRSILMFQGDGALDDMTMQAQMMF